MGLTQVNSEGIKDGEIKDADVNASAAIALSKLASTPTLLTGSTNNTITTVTGANAIQGEANLTFDGNTLTAATAVQVEGGSGDTTLKLHRTNAAGSNGNSFGNIKFTDNNDNEVAAINGIRSSAVDDADIVFKTRPTGGSATERFRIDSSGKVLLNTTDVPSQGADTFTVKASDGGNAGITIRTGTGNTGNIFFSDGTSGSGEYAGYIYYAHGTDKLHFGMDAADRLVIGSGGDIEVKTGNVVIGTAGKGIDFSANSHAGGMTSELLDGYEEGTWTPTMQYNVASSTGIYTKIGRVVHIGFYLGVSSNSTNQEMVITGLPFTALNNSGNLTGSLSATNFGSAFIFFTNNSADGIHLRNYSNTSLLMSDFSSKWLYGTATYMT